jgi:hypothetical protein
MYILKICLLQENKHYEGYCLRDSLHSVFYYNAIIMLVKIRKSLVVLTLTSILKTQDFLENQNEWPFVI